MTGHINEVADSLEDYASSRADFRNADSSQRWAIARLLVIAKSQVTASNEPEDKTTGRYGTQLVQKKCSYYHACGRAGVSMKEANAIWWNFVYDNAAPNERANLV